MSLYYWPTEQTKAWPSAQAWVYIDDDAGNNYNYQAMIIMILSSDDNNGNNGNDYFRLASASGNMERRQLNVSTGQRDKNRNFSKLFCQICSPISNNSIFFSVQIWDRLLRLWNLETTKGWNIQEFTLHGFSISEQPVCIIHCICLPTLISLWSG